MLSDADVGAIRKGLRDGMRGPVLIKWVEQLLADRDELAAKLRALEAGLYGVQDEAPERDG